MSAEKVREQFNHYSNVYDQSRRNYIPDFDNFYGVGIDVLEYDGSAPRVLDVGGGTGIFTEHLLRRYPEARVTLIDFSDKMLELAKQKFEHFSNVTTVCDDYLKHDYAGETGMGGSPRFDIIISALSIHHFDDDGKRAVYEKMHGILNHGGEFINADEANSGVPALDKKYLDMWKGFVRSRVSAGEYQSFLSKTQIDIVSPLSLQLRWLEEIGFEYADCPFRHGMFAVMYAKNK